MKPNEIILALRSRFGEAIGADVSFRGETTVRVKAASILDVCRFLMAECGFDVLTDLTACDNFGDDPRYDVVYQLYCMSRGQCLRLRAGVSEDDPAIDSVCSVWKGANWLEREAYDMYGITFRGHPDLRRILMWDGYPHFPLRKDFPVGGLPADLPDYGRDAGQAEAAPMLGGPFVATIGTTQTLRREPRQFDTNAERDEAAADEAKGGAS